jgi:hypothetical protein
MEEVNKAKRTMAAKGAATPTVKWLPQWRKQGRLSRKLLLYHLRSRISCYSFSNSNLVYSSETGCKDILRLPHARTRAHTHTLMCFTSHILLTNQLSILANECQCYTWSYRQLRILYFCIFDVGITYHRYSKEHKMKASLGDCQYTHTFRPANKSWVFNLLGKYIKGKVR